jgi:DNA repair exonuclease SbcCD ATPase subunit
MSEKQNTEPTTQNQQTGTPEAGEPQVESWRKGAEKAGIFKELKRKEAELEETRNRLQAIEAERQKAAEEAEYKKLEDAKDFETLKAKLIEDKKRMKEEFEARELRRQQESEQKERLLMLEAKLAGIQNEWTRAGVIAKCPPDADIGEYVESLPKDLFEAPGIQPAETPAQGAQSGGQSLGLEQRLRYQDPKDPAKAAVIRAEARAEKARTGGYS